MSAFTTNMHNSPGQLALLCDVLGARGVNLVLCGVAHGDSGAIAFIADNEAATREALAEASIEYVEREALTVRMRNVPGAGAGLFQMLANAGINLDVFLPVQIYEDQFYAVLCPSDMAAAASALGDHVVRD
jgi:hypothetical protein